MTLPRVDVLGVHISAVNMAMTLDAIADLIEADGRGYVCVTGVHGVIESQSDPELLRIHNDSFLTTPDGMPMVWSGRWAGADWMTRVYGPDLLLAACNEAQRRGWSFFFYGGRPGVADQLAERLLTQFPSLRVAGTHSPPFRDLTPDEDAEVVHVINAAEADILWVGISTPRQERWMARHLGRIDVPVMIGVGAAFDIHAGIVRQAPIFLQRSGLEWVWRLMQEPGRLWRRYLHSNPRFVLGIARRRPRLITTQRS